MLPLSKALLKDFLLTSSQQFIAWSHMVLVATIWTDQERSRDRTLR